MLLCAAVALGYWPALHGGFIWDDKVLLTESPLIRAADGLYRFWLTTQAPDYWPLTSTTFWFEWRMWGMDPTGYHVTNLVLHATEALLLWTILQRLRIDGAYLAALLFAVHPVNVESVAWIAQRKNLVGMLFCLLSALYYLKADEQDDAGPSGSVRLRARLWYGLSLAMFLLALLGKGSVATLPLILLLLGWWKRQRLSTRDVKRVLPFFVIAGALVLVNVWFQTHGGAAPIRNVSLVERLLGAGAVVWFYLRKALWPLHLVFIYPQWKIDAVQLLWWLPLAAALAVSAVLLRFRKTWGRPFWMSWAFFCIALLPVMGLTDVYFMTYSLVADHYQHVAIIGVIALVAAGWSRWWQRSRGLSRTVAVGVAAATVSTLVWLTFRQSATYRDEETLYTATIHLNPDCWLAHYNLAVELKAQGRRQEEIAHLLEAVRRRPDYAIAHNNLALALLEEGRSAEALTHAEQAQRLTPDSPASLVNLGIALSRAGRPSEALGPLERALQLQPDSAAAHYNLGLTLVALGRLPEAIDHYREALRLEPDSAADHTALGEALAAAGRHEEALSAFEQALRLRPGDAEAQFQLANTLVRQGRRDDAIAQYDEALRLLPDGPHAPESHYNLGVLLTAAGRKQEGMAHYARALELMPRYAEAHYNVAVALLAEGRSADAIRHLEDAVRSKPDLVVARILLADACARAGRLPEAVAHAQAALPGSPPDTRAGLERRIRSWQGLMGGR